MCQPVAIEVKGLSHRYLSFERGETLIDIVRDFFARREREIVALQDVSFEVREGEILGLLGPNGAGKTTVLKILSGLMPAQTGTVRVLGHDPYQKRREFLSNIGFVFGQKSQLNWELPAFESLDLIRTIYKVPDNAFRERLAEYQELLNFDRQLRTPVRKLSLGERMKAELMCALIHRPKVLFLDEPTIGLDIISQRAIRSFIEKIKKDHGVSVILTSHYLSDIETLADRICVLKNGAIVFDGTAKDLRARTHSNHTIKVEPVNSASASVLREFGFTPTPSGEWEKSVDSSMAQKELLRILERIPVSSVSSQMCSLEDSIYSIFSGNLQGESA